MIEIAVATLFAHRADARRRTGARLDDPTTPGSAGRRSPFRRAIVALAASRTGARSGSRTGAAAGTGARPPVDTRPACPTA